MKASERTAGRERGSATLLVAAAMGVLLTVTFSGLLLVGVAAASHRARLAADLAALAGARRIQAAVAPEAACAEARRVARGNRADLRACSVEGMDVEVIAVVAVPTWPSDAAARARAGPMREASRAGPY